MTWTKVSFGLKLSPSPTLFSRVRTEVTAPLRAKGGFCIYLDSIVIFKTDENLEKIDELLSIVIENI